MSTHRCFVVRSSLTVAPCFVDQAFKGASDEDSRDLIDRAKGRGKPSKNSGGSKAQLEAFARRLLDAEEQKIDFAGDQVYTDKQLDQLLDRSVNHTELELVAFAAVADVVVLQAKALSRRSVASPKSVGGKGRKSTSSSSGPAPAFATIDELLEKKSKSSGDGGDADDEFGDAFDVDGEIASKELDHLG